MSYEELNERLNKIETQLERLPDIHLAITEMWADLKSTASERESGDGAEKGQERVADDQVTEVLRSLDDSIQKFESVVLRKTKGKLDCGCTVTKGWRCPVHGAP